MMSPPYGVWGLTPKQLEAVPGFGRDVERSRAQARKLMQEAGYGPGNRLKTSYLVRLHVPGALSGVSLVADQLRSIYIEGEIEQKEYTVYSGALMKGAYTLAFNMTGAAIDDPDAVFFEGYTCASTRNFTRYCNREIDAKIEMQSLTVDPGRRRQVVQELDLALQRDFVQPALYQNVYTACWHPYVRGIVRAANGNYTHHRMENIWLDK